MAIEACRNLIIGTGEAGKYLAWTLAKQGQHTIAIERAAVGGACPNVACLPSKNVIFSAKVASLCSRSSVFGVNLHDRAIDMPAVIRRKQKMIDDLRQIHLNNFAATGAQLLLGEAQFIEPKTVRVALHGGRERTLTAERIFLNLGSRATLPSIPGLAESQPMTHVQALELAYVPAHLVILGGGYVGVEFAQAFRRFGSRVTILQAGPQLLAQEDPDVADAVARLLLDEGISILTHSQLAGAVGRSGQALTLHVQTPTGPITLEASDLLVAAGRTPNTDRLGLERANVALTPRRHIQVDEKLRTTAPDVWAMGDCAGSPQFTHVSFDDFRVVRDTLAGKERTTTDRLVPYCLFTDPELAHVGLNERQAQAKKLAYRVVTIAMADIFRTRTLGDTRGFAKALLGANDQILGFTAFGIEASEMMAVVQTAMLGRLPYTALADAIFTHPTMAEGVATLFTRAAAAQPRPST